MTGKVVSSPFREKDLAGKTVEIVGGFVMCGDAAFAIVLHGGKLYKLRLEELYDVMK